MSPVLHDDINGKFEDNCHGITHNVRSGYLYMSAKGNSPKNLWPIYKIIFLYRISCTILNIISFFVKIFL